MGYYHKGYYGDALTRRIVCITAQYVIRGGLASALNRSDFSFDLSAASPGGLTNITIMRRYKQTLILRAQLGYCVANKYFVHKVTDTVLIKTVCLYVVFKFFFFNSKKAGRPE